MMPCRAHARAISVQLAPAGPRHRLALDGGPRGRHEGGAASKERAVSTGWLRQGLREVQRVRTVGRLTSPSCTTAQRASDIGEDLVWALQVAAISSGLAEMLACDVRIGQCHFLRRSALLPRSNLDKHVIEGPDGRALPSAALGRTCRTPNSRLITVRLLRNLRLIVCRHRFFCTEAAL